MISPTPRRKASSLSHHQHCLPLITSEMPQQEMKSCQVLDWEPTTHCTSLSLKLKKVEMHRLSETPLFIHQNKSLCRQGLKAHCNQTWAAHCMMQITQDPLGSAEEKMVDIWGIESYTMTESSNVPTSATVCTTASHTNWERKVQGNNNSLENFLLVHEEPSMSLELVTKISKSLPKIYHSTSPSNRPLTAWMTQERWPKWPSCTPWW